MARLFGVCQSYHAERLLHLIEGVDKDASVSRLDLQGLARNLLDDGPPDHTAVLQVDDVHKSLSERGTADG